MSRRSRTVPSSSSATSDDEAYRSSASSTLSCDTNDSSLEELRRLGHSASSSSSSSSSSGDEGKEAMRYKSSRVMPSSKAASLAGIPLKTTHNLTPSQDALPLLQEYGKEYMQRKMALEAKTGGGGSSTQLDRSRPMGDLVDTRTKKLLNATSEGGQLTPSSALSSEKLASLAVRSAEAAQSGYGLGTSRRLVDKATLSPQQLTQVQLNSESVVRASRAFANADRLSQNRALFDSQFATTQINNTLLRSLFLGKAVDSATTTTLACPNGKKHSIDESAFELTIHLRTYHPLFHDAVRQHKKLDHFLRHLSRHEKRDYLLIVPTREYLEEAETAPETRLLEIVGPHIALFDRHAHTPILHDSHDRATYAYQSALSGRRIELRRLDDETIEVNGHWIAKLDHASHGHVYVMHDTTPLELLLEEEKVMHEHDRPLEVEAPTLIDLEREPDSNLAHVRLEDADFAFDEDEGPTITDLVARATPTRCMNPVFVHTTYRRQKIGILLGKMLAADYSAKKDMDHALSLDRSANVANPALSLKVFRVDELYNRHLSNALQPIESMAPIATFRFDGETAQLIDIDERLSMREYRVAEQAIKKSVLVNNVAVLSFAVPARADLCAALSFYVSDAADHKNVYMSPHENVVLRFRDNVLDTISIDTASRHFATCALATPTRITASHSLALQVRFDEKLQSRLNNRELTLEQFSAIVMPLCAPKIVKRFKAAVKTVTASTIALRPDSDQSPMSLENDAPLGSETTKQVMFMHGEKAGLMAKNTSRFGAQKQTYQGKDNPTEHADVYSFEGKRFSFKKLVTAKGKVNLMSVNLANPLEANKEKTFLFKLSNLKGVGSQYTRYVGEKGGLTFHFELNSSGEIERLIVEYLLQSKPSGHGRKRVTQAQHSLEKAASSGSGATTTTTTTTTTAPTQSLATKQVGVDFAWKSALGQFLADEAYGLQRLQLNLASNAYLESRIDSMMEALGGLSAEQKQSCLLFFAGLSEQLVTSTLNTKKEMALAASKLTTLLSAQDRERLIKNRYASGTEAMSRCQALFRETDFAKLNANETLRELIEYASRKSGDDGEARHLYMNRLTCILKQIVCSLKK